MFALIYTGCIDRYFYDAQTDFVPKMVIEGAIHNDRIEQEIIISTSVSPDSSNFKPLSACDVAVVTENGDNYTFSESYERRGVYSGLIEKDALAAGNKFMLRVVNPRGDVYESSFEEMPVTPPIDTISYHYEKRESAEDIFPEEGLQFTMNVNANNEHRRYYRWECIETYEYHSTWPIKEFIDESGRWQEVPIDYSVFTCYKTQKIDDIYILSTQGFSENRFENFPLCYVNDRTQKLMYNYSLLVKQYSITANEYVFWESLKKNNKEESDMFSKQPAIVKSNINCISNPDEKVLGYFSVAAVSGTRTVLNNVEELSFSHVKPCTPIKIEMGIPPEPRPLYLLRYTDDEGPALGWALPECVDCRLRGGTTEKPAFFD